MEPTEEMFEEARNQSAEKKKRIRIDCGFKQARALEELRKELGLIREDEKTDEETTDEAKIPKEE